MGYARRGKVAARILASGAVYAMLLPAGVLADEAAAAAPKFDTGDTAWMLTRSALGAYQKANGLKLDCWPTSAVLDHMKRSAQP